MSDAIDLDGLPADPTTAPYWRAACEHRFVVQRCPSCGAHQFYPRPFCMACTALDPEWVEVSGLGTVYSKTTVRIPVIDDLEPPYSVGIIELDEGPRLTAALIAGGTGGTEPEPGIGARVRVTWRERPDRPPLPVFESAGEG